MGNKNQKQCMIQDSEFEFNYENAIVGHLTKLLEFRYGL